MLRSCLAQASRTAKVKVELSRKLRRQQKIAHKQEEADNRPHPVTGLGRGNEHVWDKCDLAQILVSEEDLTAPSVETDTTVGKNIPMPMVFSYGIREPEAALLFHDLPQLSSTQVVDLRNANADGIHFENRLRIIREFSAPDRPFNPGRQEVQAAMLTYRIRNIWTHMSTKRYRKDVNAKRRLRELVYQRARILKYLKRTDRVRWDMLLGRLGLEPGAVEGELMV
ncbi:S15/NS1 RNA-binding domain-containing protein [Hymenopellis radicata]|nr:S15/NS1 RNA-binding domain-containing protein [Hymenopellis radicata]